MPSDPASTWLTCPQWSPVERFRPPIVSREFAAAYESVMERLAKAHVEAVDKLTREQFIEAMAQAIECGDFMRHVIVGETVAVGNSMTCSHRQGVSYVPYREVERLKARIRELEVELDQALRDANPIEP